MTSKTAIVFTVPFDVTKKEMKKLRKHMLEQLPGFSIAVVKGVTDSRIFYP